MTEHWYPAPHREKEVVRIVLRGAAYWWSFVAGCFSWTALLEGCA